MTTPLRGPRAVADVTAGAILASVEIGVPPERVFAALTDGTEVVRWWGSDSDYWTTKWTADLRVGGKWRADGKSADGRPFFVEGEFLEIDPPRKLVQTWKAAWDGGATTTITYALMPIERGTRLTLRHEGFKGRDQSCLNHGIGWERVLGWLVRYATPAPAAAPDASLYYVARLLPPRASFMQDMNADERAMMVAHAKYWTGHMAEGKLVVLGPVADPRGGWGLGVMRVASEAELLALQAGDPAITSGRGLTYENLPMARAVWRQPA